MGRWANSRVEHSHLPFRRGERAMARFRRMRTLRKFSAVHASLRNPFGTERHLTERDQFKPNRSAAQITAGQGRVAPTGDKSPSV